MAGDYRHAKQQLRLRRGTCLFRYSVSYPCLVVALYPSNQNKLPLSLPDAALLRPSSGQLDGYMSPASTSQPQACRREKHHQSAFRIHQPIANKTASETCNGRIRTNNLSNSSIRSSIPLTTVLPCSIPVPALHPPNAHSPLADDRRPVTLDLSHRTPVTGFPHPNPNPNTGRAEARQGPHGIWIGLRPHGLPPVLAEPTSLPL